MPDHVVQRGLQQFSSLFDSMWRVRVEFLNCYICVHGRHRVSIHLVIACSFRNITGNVCYCRHCVGHWAELNELELIGLWWFEQEGILTLIRTNPMFRLRKQAERSTVLHLWWPISWSLLHSGVENFSWVVHLLGHSSTWASLRMALTPLWVLQSQSVWLGQSDTELLVPWNLGCRGNRTLLCGW